MNTPATNTSINDDELRDYITRNVGISRTRLNVQAFIGLFIFGLVMKMNYDDLKQGGFGWAFLVVMAILFAVGRQAKPGAFILMSIIYVGAWIHTNVILSQRENTAREKFFALKNEKAKVSSSQTLVSGSADSAIQPTENG